MRRGERGCCASSGRAMDAPSMATDKASTKQAGSLLSSRCLRMSNPSGRSCAKDVTDATALVVFVRAARSWVAYRRATDAKAGETARPRLPKQAMND